MKQAVMTQPGNVEFRDVPMPTPADDEILVRIVRIGICGSDIHVYHGKHPYTKYPVVQGHEIAGDVVDMGTAAAGHFARGDRVTIQPQVMCGRCYACTHGNYHICDDLKVMGFQTTGMASEYFAVGASKALKLPADMSYDFGAMVEPLAVAVHALGRSGMGIAGKRILVLGAGPIGNLVAQAAKAMGAVAVMITDISDYRLALAKQCGVDYAVNTGKEALSDAITQSFGPDKADLILECIGINPTMTQAIDNARKGSDIIVVGVFGDKATVDLGLVQDRELRLIGTLMYREDDFRRAIAMIDQGLINLQALISNHFPFHEYQRAYEYIENNREQAMKIMIDVAES